MTNGCMDCIGGVWRRFMIPYDTNITLNTWRLGGCSGRTYSYPYLELYMFA